MVTLIIITIGASIFLRGLAMLVWDKKLHALKPFTGDTPIAIAGATILPQSLWVLGVTLAIVLALSWFFGRTLLGKAMLATSHNRLAAQLVRHQRAHGAVAVVRPVGGARRDRGHPDRADHHSPPTTSA